MLVVAIAIALSRFDSEPVLVIGPKQLQGVKEPQAAVDDEGHIHIVFGAGSAIYCCNSEDKGQSFSDPIKIADTSGLALGGRRGPKVAISNDNVIVSAVTNGNLMSWVSTSGGQSFKDSPVQINDSDASAIEGLHAEASNAREVACAWLDHRDGGQELYASISQDGGENWGPNTLVYKSPSGSVCECCAPSITIGSDGTIHVMFRNSLDGNRDMYLVDSPDGQTWTPAQLLGNGHWKLAACPMDGGAVDGDDQSQTFTIWRRGDSVYRQMVGEAESKIGVGQQPWLYAGEGVYCVYLKSRPGPLMMFKGIDAPRALTHDADDPVVAGPVSGDGPVVAVWMTSKGEIMSQVLNDSPNF